MQMEEDAGWHSSVLLVLYHFFGWFAFTVWSISFYPQVILNYQRKSVAGMHFDFLVFNFTKHSSYLIYNASLFFSPVLQSQYRAKYGASELIPVAPSDVAFSIHAVLLTSVNILQVFIYDRGGQKVSWVAKGITILVWGTALVILLLACPSGDWLWLIDGFNLIQLLMTSIKYIPQAYFNFRRKSTVGWSIHNILLDLSGGIGNFVQMGIQSFDQDSVTNIFGNIGKLGLSLESIFFDVLFVLQHYVLYSPPKSKEPVDEYEAIEETDPET